MKVIVNKKEIVDFLISFIDHTPYCQTIKMTEENIGESIYYVLEEKSKRKFDIKKMRKKLKDKIRRGVQRDLEIYVENIKTTIQHRKTFYHNLISKNLDNVLSIIGEEAILEKFKKSNCNSFVRSSGLILDPNATFIRRNDYTDNTEDCFFRNMEGNEEMLLNKMDNNLPFWFIDTGYTNFLNGKKKTWHRLTRNHLHQVNVFDAPVDRLGMFEFFPQQWRTPGEKILVIEPGQFSAKTFNVDISKWRYNIEKEIRQYSDKPIVFREKIPKKRRSSLFKELQDEDYYCLININSNAAIEGIWSGIPVITLHKHISNPVSRNKISDINNLYRPHLANWLCMLSYSQFTQEEIMNGTAINIVRKFYV